MLSEKDSPRFTKSSPARWKSSQNLAGRRRRLLLITSLILFITALLLLAGNSSPETHLELSFDDTNVEFVDTNSITSIQEEDHLNHVGSHSFTIANSTLDFGKIYVLNLEAREDRRDEMSMAAAAAGIEFTYVAGVNSANMNTQSLPDIYGTEQVILEPAHLACYRGHANIWRRIIDDGVDTALIVEDDVDFDLNIRDSMALVKKGLGDIIREKNAFTNTKAWDIFYVGTCYEDYLKKTEDENEYDLANETFIEVPKDKPNLDDNIYDWVQDILMNYFNSSSPRRVVVKAKNPVCTHGYAVTQRGARKLLMMLNEWMPYPVDITMIHYISEGEFKAYSVLPPMFVQWRNTKDPKRNSDIEEKGIELERNWGIKRSVRKHMIDWVTLGATGHHWWDVIPVRSD